MYSSLSAATNIRIASLAIRKKLKTVQSSRDLSATAAKMVIILTMKLDLTEGVLNARPHVACFRWKQDRVLLLMTGSAFIRGRSQGLESLLVVCSFVVHCGAASSVLTTLLNVPITVQIPFTAGRSQRQIVGSTGHLFHAYIPGAGWNHFCFYVSYEENNSSKECFLCSN